MNNNKRKLSHSQNFLKDSKLVAELVSGSSITNSDVVFEVGPGKGIITQQLSKRAGKVIAIEYDKNLAFSLKQRFANYKNVKIIYGNFLSTKLPKKDSYKLFSNIPFNLTAEILDKITTTVNPPIDSYLIIQEEAAKKYAGHPYGEERLCSLILKPKFELAIIYRFRRTDFFPIPNVSIVMLRIKKREQFLLKPRELAMFNDFVAYTFHQQGKNLKERLKRVFTAKQFRRQSLEQKFDLLARPGDLSFE